MLLCRDRARLVIFWKKETKVILFSTFFLDFFPCDQGRPNTTLAWPGGCTCVSVWPPPDVAAPLLPTTKTTFHNILPSFICVPSFTSYFATFVCSSHLLIMLRLLFKFQWARGSLSDGVSYRKWQLWRDFFPSLSQQPSAAIIPYYMVAMRLLDGRRHEKKFRMQINWLQILVD